MRSAVQLRRPIAMFAIVVLTAAGSAGYPTNAANAAAAPEPFAWPASLAPFGNGYPNAGNACRRLGESPATSAYLDHTATLVGCPGGGDSASVRAMLRDPRAHVVGEADGVTLISIPTNGMGSGGTGQGHRKGCH
jgi:hypothetical protein